jgi:ligand-binding sensor domain-containing protein
MTPHLRVLALTLTLTSLTVSDARAQRESWTVKDGLPVNSINAILQDRRGYIWAATYDGLVRYDVVRFTVINSANSAELPSNRIVQLQEGRDGALWVATAQGTSCAFAMTGSPTWRSRTGRLATGYRTY